MVDSAVNLFKICICKEVFVEELFQLFFKCLLCSLPVNHRPYYSAKEIQATVYPHILWLVPMIDLIELSVVTYLVIGG